MKKIYLIVPLLFLSFVFFGCGSSGSSSSNNNENNLSEEQNQTTTIEQNQTQEQNNSSILDTNNPKNDLENNNSENTENNTTNIASEKECPFGEVYNEETGECEADKNIKATSNGTVRDGLIKDATVSVSKVINNELTEANTSCSKTDEKGQYICLIYEDNYDYLVFKAVGGTDIGENEANIRDDKPNQDILKSILTKDEIENNKTNFISPATTLVVLKALNNSWNVETARTEIAQALNVNIDDLLDPSKGIEVTRLVANLVDVTAEDNRSEMLQKLSTKNNIEASKDLITDLNPNIQDDEATILADLVQDAVKNPSDTQEALIDVITDRVKNDKNVSDVIVSNFKTVLTNNFKDSSNSRKLDLIAKIPTVKDANTSKDISNKIDEILNNVTDDSKAIEIISQELEKDKDLTDLTVNSVKSQLGEIVCDEGYQVSSTGICELIPEKLPKDEVNSPDDIPALPTQNPQVIQESEFPTIPSDEQPARFDDTNTSTLVNPSDSDYPDINQSSDSIEDSPAYQAE